MSSLIAASASSTAQDELPQVLIAMLKGVLYRDSEPRLWGVLLQMQSEATDYMAKLALVLYVDTIEGYGHGES